MISSTEFSVFPTKCKNGVFNLNTFIEYVKEVMKYIKKLLKFKK